MRLLVTSELLWRQYLPEQLMTQLSMKPGHAADLPERPEWEPRYQRVAAAEGPTYRNIIQSKFWFDAQAIRVALRKLIQKNLKFNLRFFGTFSAMLPSLPQTP